MTKKQCPLGEDCDLTLAWMLGAKGARAGAKTRIEALEAKLAKAVEALTARRDELKDHGYTTGHAIACGILTAVLAEIEGDKP